MARDEGGAVTATVGVERGCGLVTRGLHNGGRRRSAATAQISNRPSTGAGGMRRSVATALAETPPASARPPRDADRTLPNYPIVSATSKWSTDSIEAPA